MTAEEISRAAALLGDGKLVAFPTETVYGLGVDATNEAAVRAVYKAKGRPNDNPLIVHLADLAAARREAIFDSRAESLAKRFWPGPLTLVLRRRIQSSVSILVSAGLKTVALRVPSHGTALRLLRTFGRPVAAPSANPSGRLSPTLAAHVAAGLGDAVAMILDDGPCSVGLESTVVGLDGPARLLRSGAVSSDAIEAEIGPLLAPLDAVLRAPGMMASHYAPRLPLRLDAAGPHQGEAFLGFGPGFDDATLNLSPTGDMDEAAANLFAMLHDLDRVDKYIAIAVAPIPKAGRGVAINDRLERGAVQP